jgi:hypothetical protein
MNDDHGVGGVAPVAGAAGVQLVEDGCRQRVALCRGTPMPDIVKKLTTPA